jgi:hypothetical protein
MKRTLSLSREALTELSTDEMSAVAGAQQLPPWTPVIHTYPVNDCIVIAVSSLCLTRGDTCVNC